MNNTTSNGKTNATPQIMAEIVAGEAVSLAQLARKVPGRGSRPTAPSTINRWVLGGVAVEGRRIKLEAARIGGRLVSTNAALRRFLDATNGIGGDTQPLETLAAPKTCKTTREAQVAGALAELADAGAA